jgi:hypothetical protein
MLLHVQMINPSAYWIMVHRNFHYPHDRPQGLQLRLPHFHLLILQNCLIVQVLLLQMQMQTLAQVHLLLEGSEKFPLEWE